MGWIQKLISMFDVNRDNKITAEDLELAKALTEEKYRTANARINDQITDAVTTVETTVNETKRRVKRVKEEVADTKDAIEQAVDQIEDVVAAAKGKSRSGRKPKATKKA